MTYPLQRKAATAATPINPPRPRPKVAASALETEVELAVVATEVRVVGVTVASIQRISTEG